MSSRVLNPVRFLDTRAPTKGQMDAFVRTYFGADWWRSNTAKWVDTYTCKVQQMLRHGSLKKYQKGNLNVFPAGTQMLIDTQLVPFVQSGLVVVNEVASGLVNAGIVYNYTTGAFDNNELIKRHNAVYTAMGNDDAFTPYDYTGEPWAAIVTGSEWEVACTSEDTGTWDFPFAIVGTYNTFATADMAWRENRTGGKGYTPGTDSCTATFRIREVADTANFTSFTVQAIAIQT